MDAVTQSAPIPSFPRLGMPAPPFQAETTHGTLRLEDFKGGWLILFSHPADFTPVCTTGVRRVRQDRPGPSPPRRGTPRPFHRQHILPHRLGAEHRASLQGADPLPVIADLNKRWRRSTG